jgi:NAD(P)-dependent dehydrogenase (short-subunit alcohol dehydrogenase family)
MKLAIITGSNGQLGREMNKAFKYGGWQTFGIDITSSTSEESKTDFFYNGSVSKRSTFERIFFNIEELGKTVEKISLINNAGIAVFTPSEERTDEEIEKVSQINLNSVIYGITELAKYVEKKKRNSELVAKAVNIASIYGLISPNNSIYTDTARNSSEIYGATKAGVIQMTKYFAARYARLPISINCIAPGGVLNKEVQGDEFIKNYSGLVPQKRLCYSKEVAELTYFLGSNAIEYLSGQTIALDGGMTGW